MPFPKKGTPEYEKMINSQRYKDFRKRQSERMRGTHQSDKSKEKISAARTGTHPSDTTRHRMSKSHTGRKRKPFSKKWRENISKSRKGKCCGKDNGMFGVRLCGKNNGMFGRHHTQEARMAVSAANTGRTASDALRTILSINAMGKRNPMFGKNRPDLSERNKSDEMRKFTLERQRGDKNHQWNGGTSFEPYPITFNKRFKKFIRNYYGNICINCGKTPEENGEELTCHHYDYDKISKNCVPTCISCNSIANGSRGNGSRAFWEDWYIEILNEFYVRTFSP